MVPNMPDVVGGVTSGIQNAAVTNPVSWQTAWWSLVPLAICTMTQPSGKVCGLPGRYRTYLRSSPIVCFVDAVTFIVTLAMCLVCVNGPALHTLQLNIQSRFEEDHTMPKSLRKLEDSTFFRWIFFLLGTLPPAIKLAAMDGIFWTKVFGMMFLGSFLFIELLLITSRLRIIQEPLVSGRSNLSQLPVQDITANEFLVVLSIILCVYSKVGTLYWAYAKLWENSGSESDPRTRIGLPLELLFVCAAYISIFSVAATYARAIYHTLNHWNRANCVGSLVEAILTTAAAGSLTWFLVMLSFSDTAGWGLGLRPYVPLYLFPLCFTGALMYVLISAASASWPALGRSLLVSYPRSAGLEEGVTDAIEIPLDIDQNSLWAFLFFAANFSISLAWYAVVYSPKDTNNPSWTGVFG